MFSPRNVNHLEGEPQCFLLQSEKPRVVDVSQGFIVEYSQQWFVIDCNYQFITAEDEMFRLKETLYHSETLALHWTVPRLVGFGESPSSQDKFPPVIAALWV